MSSYMRETEQELEVRRAQIELLIDIEKYLAAGVHIGTHICTKTMKQFVYRIRPDGIYILDVRKIDERLRIAANMLSTAEPGKLLVVSVRQYGFTPVEKFSHYTGAKAVIGRFMPGTLTNPRLEWYVEPDVVLVTDPRADEHAVLEASNMGIPVVAFVDTDNRTDDIDLVIPANNKGRKSLALLYWLLAREILRARGLIAKHQSLPEPPAAFEAKASKVAA
ncbi:MAG: 30S ribosomal protein S2 [Fervidicoccaceae archaeon]